MTAKELLKSIVEKGCSIFQWDGKINLGNILTVFAIIIAYRGFIVQKQSVDIKVDKLQAIVDSLEEEKNNRLLQGLNQEEKSLNHFSYNLKYTTDQVQAVEMISDNESIYVLAEIDYIIGVLQKHEPLSIIESKQLANLKLRNINQIQVFASSINYNKKIVEFDSLFHPKRDNYKSIDDYILAQGKFNDTLSKHIKYLVSTMQNEINEPIRKVIQLEKEFFDSEINAIQHSVK